ncbi:ATP-binding protein, partial [bacterium]
FERDDARLVDAVALEDVVRDVVASRAEDLRARIAFHPEASGTVRGDETLLRALVENLVDNALKFDRSGAIAVTVSEDEANVFLSVRDEGPGVAPHEIEALLAPFVRGTAGSSAPGHGLGLAIVAHVVRLHGGVVRFVPRDSGAEISVSLPVWKASPPV